MVGSYATLFLTYSGVPFWVAALRGVAASSLAGLQMERIGYSPIRGAQDVAMLLISVAVTIFLENMGLLLFSPSSRPFMAPSFLNSALNFGALRVNSVYIIAIVVVCILLVFLTFFITRTDSSALMRAVSQDMLASRLMGINTNKVFMTAFGIGSLLAGVVGILWSARVGKIDPLMGFTP